MSLSYQFRLLSPQAQELVVSVPNKIMMTLQTAEISSLGKS